MSIVIVNWLAGCNSLEKLCKSWIHLLVIWIPLSVNLVRLLVIRIHFPVIMNHLLVIRFIYRLFGFIS